jgi:predicted PhzF superfamily epimerase YddE/YHI9
VGAWHTLPMLRPFAQVDVFTTTPYRGNPVAVVLDGEALPSSRCSGSPTG